MHISQVIYNACLSFEAVAFERNVGFHLQIHENLWANIIKEDMERISYILIDNAIKYCDEKGSVHIRLLPHGGASALTISNAFISQIFDAERNFDRFYKTSDKPNSFGLGLSICAEICNQYHIKMETAQDGKKVSITLHF